MMQRSSAFAQDPTDSINPARPKLRASFSDWMRPSCEQFLKALESGAATLLYEDRVLIKRLPKPPRMGVVVSPQPNLRQLAWKEGPDTGIQRGEIVATGPGNSGLTILRFDKRGQKTKKLIPFREPIPCILAAGSVVLYYRVPPQEFEHARDTYTFAFEEQHILAELEPETMKIIPLYDRVIVKRLEGREEIGGIVIPETAKEKPQQGEVISVGPGRLTEEGALRPLSLAAGDRVLFGKYAGSDIDLDGQELLIMREEEIFGVIRAE